MGRQAHGLLQCAQVGAATLRGAKTTAPASRCGRSASAVTPSAATGTTVASQPAHSEPGCWSSGGPAPGAAGGRGTIWHERSARKRSETKCSAAQCVSSGPVRHAGPSVAVTRRTSGRANPDHGKGRHRDDRRRGRPDRIARGREGFQGRVAGTCDVVAWRLGAQHANPSPRSGEVPAPFNSASERTGQWAMTPRM